MSITIKKKPAVVIATTEHKSKGIVISEEHNQTEQAMPNGGAQLGNPHAMIEVTSSLTINLGNFNSVKVGVSIALPSNLDELDQVFEYGRTWMNTKLEGMVADVSPDTPPED